jgi:hypothetical protein
MNKKKIAVLQSNYIPWKGYFDLINMVDEFVILDSVQYTRRDWRNRNKIKTPRGPQWLSIPVEVKGKYDRPIKEIKISDSKWAKNHWASIQHNYSKAEHFSYYKSFFEELYLANNQIYLSEINYSFILAINLLLEIKTKISWSDEFEAKGKKTELILSICKACNATDYLSGPAAKDYLNENLAKEQNVNIHWMDYSGYPTYNQLFPPFEHGVSILDLIFNEGPNAKDFMKSFH